MIAVMPAASAARTPGSESSSTTHVAGIDAEARRGLEEDVGRRLAARDLVAADERRETVRREPVCASFACARERRVDVATAFGNGPRSRATRAARSRPGFSAMPSRSTIGVVRAVPGAHQLVDRIVVAVVRADQRHAIGKVAADEPRRHGAVEGDAAGGRGVGPRACGERLGVEHQAVHVEDHRGGPPDRTRRARHRRAVRRGRDSPPCAGRPVPARRARGRSRRRARRRRRATACPAGAAGAATMSCTCSFAALPWPTTACFTCSAVYSATGSPASTAAEIAAPRACPSSSVDCGLTLTNTFSTATSVGPVARDDLAEVVQDDTAGARAGCPRVAPDAAAGDVGELVAADVDDAESGDPQPGIDAEDAPQLRVAGGEARSTRRYSSMTALV